MNYYHDLPTRFLCNKVLDPIDMVFLGTRDEIDIGSDREAFLLSQLQPCFLYISVYKYVYYVYVDLISLAGSAINFC